MEQATSDAGSRPILETLKHLNLNQVSDFTLHAVDARMKRVVQRHDKREAALQTQIDDLTKAVAALTKVVAKSQG